jgi:hypothetical protein
MKEKTIGDELHETFPDVPSKRLSEIRRKIIDDFQRPWNPKRHRVECICHDDDCEIRLTFDDEEKWFYFSGKINRFPGCQWYKITFSGRDKWYVKFGKHVKLRYCRLRNYLKGVWWAIKGRPQWYEFDNIMDLVEAKKLVNFINEVMEEGELNGDKA